MYSFLPNQDQFYSDLEISEPGTVRVTMNRSHYLSDNNSDYQDEFNQSANYYGSDFQLDDDDHLGTEEQVPCAAY
jgi:hypothetical protein